MSDITASIATAIQAKTGGNVEGEIPEWWAEFIDMVLAELQSAGRLIPTGGMALTAEQVEDVRTVAWHTGAGLSRAPMAEIHRLRALFPATEPAEERCQSVNIFRERCALVPGHDGRHAANGCAWGYPPTPTEPTEEETKAEYPRTDGDFTVLGQEIFTDASGEFICWKGVNYVRQPDPASSPVVPAPTETGPWA